MIRYYSSENKPGCDGQSKNEKKNNREKKILTALPLIMNQKFSIKSFKICSDALRDESMLDLKDEFVLLLLKDDSGRLLRKMILFVWVERCSQSSHVMVFERQICQVMDSRTGQPEQWRFKRRRQKSTHVVR
jgi:hypothetical protein